jgi:xanthine dehydrogenase YagR molybdenum-binding subunit
VTSAIAKGRIQRLDVQEAKAVPGVLDILTYENTIELKPLKFGAAGSGSTSIQSLGPDVAHAGQIIAVVVADTFEGAREAARRVRVDYAASRPSATFGAPGVTEEDATKVSEQHSSVPQVGDAEAALASADVIVDAEYTTPTQHHNPIELFATTCVWTDDRLTIYEPSQFVYGLRNGIAQRLGMDPAKVRVVSRFVGGAFGSKGQVTPRTALIALAAKRLGRPVKLVATRDQGFTVSTYRAETRHRIRLGARRDGQLVGYWYEGWELSSRPDSYVVAGVEESACLYAFGAVRTKVNIVHADRSTPGFMRSPPMVPYIYALETAMDELAIKLGVDPVELRRINDTMTDPVTGRPYSRGSEKLMYATGAEFVEVRVHAATREIRVPRIVGAFAAGRLMNTRTARSQLMGGMIWGIGSALHEATEIDPRDARYVTSNLADYSIPVNAEVKQLDVILVSELDHEVNPAGVKGLGELGNVGTAAAISNAVYHATGQRIRKLPIRLEDLLQA